MRGLIGGLRQFRQWERSSQVGFVAALTLMVVVAGAASRAPQELRGPAVASLMTLIFIAQAIFMWANRRMVTPYTQAQQAYLREDFQSAALLLETLRSADKADVRALTLLGNTYRQLGRLDESKQVLYEALNIQPDSHFSLYGFGRTLLSEGDYAGAADALQRAVAHGAPPVIRFDLGEALYRQGEYERSLVELQAVRTLVEDTPYRNLMVQWMMFRQGQGHPPQGSLVRDGLPFWQASAQRFHATPYGKALLADLAGLDELRSFAPSEM